VGNSKVYEVLWSPLAISDTERIIVYLKERNPVYAKNLEKRIRRFTDRLTHFPLRGRLVPEFRNLGLDIFREMIVAPYRILYRVQGKQVGIVGVFDGRRDMEEVLFDRLTRLP